MFVFNIKKKIRKINKQIRIKISNHDKTKQSTKEKDMKT